MQPSLSAKHHSHRLVRSLGVGAGGLGMSRSFSHVPVMLEEVLEAFTFLEDGVVLDATVGGGGHAAALLEAHPAISLIGVDQDEEAVEAARTNLARFGERARVVHASFFELERVLEERQEPGFRLVGALFDLGVSSHQLDVAERGFSIHQSGPLDMRMNKHQAVSAADLVNCLSEEQLAALFLVHGEGRLSHRIARAIVSARPLQTTEELAEVVSSAVPPARRRRGHPARRVFQALRVEVNSELDLLGPALDAVIDRLRPRGRIVVVSYHSGEDRIVKDRFLNAERGGCTCPPGLPCVCGAVARVKVLTRGARRPSEAEISRNPRSSAARLRIAERLDEIEKDAR